MATISIVYFSGYGHTGKIAQAIAEASGAQLVAIDKSGNLTDAQWEILNQSQTIVLGSPTYMGSVAWQFKKFAEDSSKIWFKLGWKDKLFAGFTNSASMNGDKFSTLTYFHTLAMQHGGLWVGLGLPPANAKASTRDDVNYVAGFGGLMTTTPADASPDEMVAGDIATAKAFGKRLAEVTLRLSR